MRLRKFVIGAFLFASVLLLGASAVLFGFYFWGLHVAGNLPSPPRDSQSALVRGALWAELESADAVEIRRLNPYTWSALFYCYGSSANWRDCRRRYPGHALAGVVAADFLPSTLSQGQRHLAGTSLAIWLTRHWSTDQLLDFAANTLYFGNNAIGVNQAAAQYFDSTASALEPQQAALLAAFAHAPARFAAEASCHPSRAIERRNRLLNRMVQQATVSPSQAQVAAAQPLGVRLPPIACDQLRPDA